MQLNPEPKAYILEQIGLYSRNLNPSLRVYSLEAWVQVIGSIVDIRKLVEEFLLSFLRHVGCSLTLWQAQLTAH